MMTRDLSSSFAAVTAQLEDLHGVAVEGQRSGNSPDMNMALIGLLRSGVTGLEDQLKAMCTLASGVAYD